MVRLISLTSSVRQTRPPAPAEAPERSRASRPGGRETPSAVTTAIVFATAADAQKTIAAYMKPSTVSCMKHELVTQFKDEKKVKLLGVSTSVLRRHLVGDQFRGVRLTLNLAKGKAQFKFFIDAFMVRQDRALAEFSYMNAFRPAATGTEYTLAEAIAQRGALG